MEATHFVIGRSRVQLSPSAPAFLLFRQEPPRHKAGAPPDLNQETVWGIGPPLRDAVFLCYFFFLRPRFPRRSGHSMEEMPAARDSPRSGKSIAATSAD